jgi:AcrR family transcriptional regulator
MVRVVKDPTVRRTEILDVAQRLLVTRGYEQMGVQDILDELQISKGAFYHYFDSKRALLAAVIDRMQDALREPLISLVADAELSATDKLRGFFSTAFGWKTTQRELFMNLLGVWYSPENAMVRQQVRDNALRRLAPVFQNIIDQGVSEQALTIGSPEDMGRVALVVAIDLSDRVAAWLLADASTRQPIADIVHTVALYSAAVERLLGAPSGTIEIFDPDLLAQWAAPAPRQRSTRHPRERRDE